MTRRRTGLRNKFIRVTMARDTLDAQPPTATLASMKDLEEYALMDSGGELRIWMREDEATKQILPAYGLNTLI